MSAWFFGVDVSVIIVVATFEAEKTVPRFVLRSCETKASKADFLSMWTEKVSKSDSPPGEFGLQKNVDWAAFVGPAENSLQCKYTYVIFLMHF